MNEKTYEVTDTRKIDHLSQAGRALTSYQISVTTNRGATGTVTIKEADYKKEKLPGILQDFADLLDLAWTASEL